MSVYADDITLSAGTTRRDVLRGMRNWAKRIIRSHGFTPHPVKSKTWVHGASIDEAAEVVGIKISRNRSQQRTHTPKRLRRKLRAVQHRLPYLCTCMWGGNPLQCRAHNTERGLTAYDSLVVSIVGSPWRGKQPPDPTTTLEKVRGRYTASA